MNRPGVKFSIDDAWFKKNIYKKVVFFINKKFLFQKQQIKDRIIITHCDVFVHAHNLTVAVKMVLCAFEHKRQNKRDVTQAHMGIRLIYNYIGISTPTPNNSSHNNNNVNEFSVIL